MEEEAKVDHEGMRRLVLGCFKDDVFLRQEVELWLDSKEPKHAAPA